MKPHQTASQNFRATCGDDAHMKERPHGRKNAETESDFTHRVLAARTPPGPMAQTLSVQKGARRKMRRVARPSSAAGGKFARSQVVIRTRTPQVAPAPTARRPATSSPSQHAESRATRWEGFRCVRVGNPTGPASLCDFPLPTFQRLSAPRRA